MCALAATGICRIADTLQRKRDAALLIVAMGSRPLAERPVAETEDPISAFDLTDGLSAHDVSASGRASRGSGTLVEATARIRWPQS